MQSVTAPLVGPSHLHALAKNWWLVLLRGIVSILFGIVAFVWPGLTLVTLVLFYGAFALVDGVIALASAFGKDRPAPTWWLILVGLAGIGAGVITFLWPGDVTLVLVIFIGAWALVHGIFEIVGAIRLRKEIENEWWLILAGIISVLFGLLVLIAPIPAAIGLVWAIAAYSIAFGVLLVGLSFRLRKHQSPAATVTASERPAA